MFCVVWKLYLFSLLPFTSPAGKRDIVTSLSLSLMINRFSHREKRGDVVGAGRGGGGVLIAVVVMMEENFSSFCKYGVHSLNFVIW